MNSRTQDLVRSQGFAVVDCDIPDGMTIAEYRAARSTAAPRRPRRLVRRRRRRG